MSTTLRPVRPLASHRRPSPHRGPAGSRSGWPMLAASLPMFMATLDNLVMTSALPVIRADLGSSVGQLSWFMNAYTLAFATFMLPAATLGDRLGRRRVMLAGIDRLHPRLDRLGAEHHLGGADRRPGGPGPRRGRDHAAVADPARLGGARRRCAPPRSASGAASPASASRSARSSAAPSSRASAGRRSSGSTSRSRWSRSRCCWSRSPSRRAPGSGSTWSAPLLLGGAVFLGIWGIVHGNDDGWTLAGVLGPAGRRRRCWCRRTSPGPAAAPTPCCRCGCSPSRGFSVANVIGLTFTLGMFGTVFLLAQYLQVVQGYSPLEAGIRTLPWTAAPMVVAPIAGAARAAGPGSGRCSLTGLVLQTASLVWFAWLTENGSAYSVVPGAAGDGRRRHGADLRAERDRGAARGCRTATSRSPARRTPRSASSASRSASRCWSRSSSATAASSPRTGTTARSARRCSPVPPRWRSPWSPRSSPPAGSAPGPDPTERPPRVTRVRRPPRRTRVLSP